MAEKGELICDNSVTPSPAATPRQSMTEVESSKQTGGETTNSSAESTTEDNQKVKIEAELAEAKADTEDSSTTTPSSQG